MSKIFSLFSRPLFSTLALSGALLPACGGSDVVTPSASSIDRSVRALTGAGGAALVPKVIKGTYGANCKIHHGETWDLKLNDPTDKSLEVALNDTVANCPLTMTTVSVQLGSSTQLADYPVAPPVVLGLSYAASASAINQPNPAALAFYGNARLTSLAGPTYTNNFGIDIVYSDDSTACGAVAPPAIYAKVTATATGTSVPPPNYTMGFDSLQLVVDANKVVQGSSAGNIVLKYPAQQGQGGEQWKTFDESTLCCSSYSFAEIDNLYKNGGPVGTGPISGPGDINIPWTNFALAGFTLPKSRTVVVKHTDGGGVYSYELFQILFPGPN